MGVIGCILGFLIVIYLCYKDWSVYLATFAGACVVIACNTLPFIDSLVGDYVSGMFTAVKGFFFMILFGCLQSKIYTESGAAYTIADTVMNRLLKENMSNTGKNLIAMAVILVIGTILNLGGIIAGVVIVLMYPIALVIFERCDIPKKFILGILGAGSFTFTLTVPGSPQVTNVAAMTVLGTAADVALVPGLVGAAAEIAAILVIMNLLINRARKRGEHFELHPLDPRYDSTGSKPKLIVALIPMVVLFLLFNIWKLNINICLLCSIALSLVLFWPQLRRKDLKAMLNSGAVDSVPMTMTVAAICGFAGVITNTDAFQSMITAITSISIAPILICWVVVALMCMLTGGSSTGQLDLMFANAGIATAGWVYNHPPQDWAWAMNTNVLGLTYYVHEVLPIFKQQGTPCHFLFTASIAGLITGLRYNTAYLASKHAAVCIAEAVRDLAENDPDYSMMGVSVFCPEYVHTNIHNSEDHRPADYSVPCNPFYATDSYWDYRRLFDSNITVKGMNPAFVGPYLFEAVEENHMYKVPHMHTHEQIRARHRRIESDLEREEALHEKYAPLQKY